MLGESSSIRATEDFVEFWSTGVQAKGEFHCSGCGYGVTIHRSLPRCPMCGGEVWEQTSWSPFSRSQDAPARYF
jgi:rubrerythrin